MSIKETVKKLAQSKNLTLEDLATKSGISRGTFYNILRLEDGKLSQFKKIAEALEVDIFEMLGSDKDISKPFVQGDGNFTMNNSKSGGDMNVKGNGGYGDIDEIKKKNEFLEAENKSLEKKNKELYEKLLECKDSLIKALGN
ncbi:helix-turn-helix transcriptional regulator [Rapidithrix thailandica]|uniref:Helix-turn-helix transcriptional regulator n=1 Tax=Rapidithrix thailandica TaxID=413964 RepID=A0AAW9S9C8_9BACT